MQRLQQVDMAKRRKVEPEILQAAIGLFGTYGLHGVTTRDLAQEAQVMEGSIYKWFENKDRLYLKATNAVISQMNAAFHRFVVAVVGKSQEFDPKRLQEALKIWYQSIPEQAARLLIQVMISDPKLSKTVIEPIDQFTNVIADNLERQKRGSRKFDSHAAARTLVRSLLWAKVSSKSASAAEEDMKEILEQWMASLDGK